jgi:hypothetical protein
MSGNDDVIKEVAAFFIRSAERRQVEMKKFLDHRGNGN